MHKGLFFNALVSYQYLALADCKFGYQNLLGRKKWYLNISSPTDKQKMENSLKTNSRVTCSVNVFCVKIVGCDFLNVIFDSFFPLSRYVPPTDSYYFEGTGYGKINIEKTATVLLIGMNVHTRSENGLLLHIGSEVSYC